MEPDGTNGETFNGYIYGYGFTDNPTDFSLCFSNGMLLNSSYDIKTEYGYLNNYFFSAYMKKKYNAFRYSALDDIAEAMYAMATLGSDLENAGLEREINFVFTDNNGEKQHAFALSRPALCVAYQQQIYSAAYWEEKYYIDPNGTTNRYALIIVAMIINNGVAIIMQKPYYIGGSKINPINYVYGDANEVGDYTDPFINEPIAISRGVAIGFESTDNNVYACFVDNVVAITSPCNYRSSNRTLLNPLCTDDGWDLLNYNYRGQFDLNADTLNGLHDETLRFMAADPENVSNHSADMYGTFLTTSIFLESHITESSSSTVYDFLQSSKTNSNYTPHALAGPVEKIAMTQVKKYWPHNNSTNPKVELFSFVRYSDAELFIKDVLREE